MIREPEGKLLLLPRTRFVEFIVCFYVFIVCISIVAILIDTESHLGVFLEKSGIEIEMNGL